MERIYVDHAATTPMHPEVIDKMIEVMKNEFGNPSSIHSFGRRARRILDEAREILARSIGASADEIILTSGGTEADNLALFGAARAMKEKGKHIITTAVEHHAVLHACRQLEKEGFEVTYLPVNENGVISPDDFHAALRDDTILVSVMYGNNETGALQPVAEIGEALRGHQALFHCDAVQAYGLEDIDVHELNIDLLAVSAHKINGPKGSGFLYAGKKVRLMPLFFGGEQERKRRAGTENVAAAAGFAAAVEIIQREKDERREKYGRLKQLLVEELTKQKVEFMVNGNHEKGLPHVINICFPETDVEAMLVNLDLAGIAASSGSACTAGSIHPSHVLVAMFGKDSERLRSSIRFSFGLNNTEEQVKKVARETATIVRRLTGN